MQSKGLIRFTLARDTSRTYGGSPAARARLMYPNGLQYLALMTVSGVDFWMSIDTGSSFLWVPGKNATCNGFPCSTTLRDAVPKDLPDFFSQYGGGGVRGQTFNAAVTFAELNFSILAGAANDIQGWVIVAKEQDGLVGLGFPASVAGIVPAPESRDVFDALTFEELQKTNMILQLYRAGHLQSPMFSLMLPPMGVDGELILGGVDETIHTCGMVSRQVVGPYGSPFNWLNRLQYWTISIDAAYMGQKPLPFLAKGTVLLDSGFFSINMSPELMRLYRNEVWDLGITITLVPLDPADPGGTAVFLVPCAKLEAMPSLAFLIGGVEHRLSAQQMAFSDMNTMHDVLHGYYPPFQIDEGTCMLAITSLPTPGMDFILGQPFLHTVYTAFSMEDPPHVSIGKLECSDGVDDTISNTVIGIVMGIVLVAIFLGLVLWLLFRSSK